MTIKNFYEKIKLYIHNALWIAGDRVVSLGVGFVISVILARYLGPDDFGVFSYAVSIAALFAAAGHMGLSGLVVKEIVKKPRERGVTLGTTFGLKLLGMSAGYVTLLLYALLYEGAGTSEFLAIAIAGAALIFRPFDILDFWFQAFVQARYASAARIAGLMAGTALKLLFVTLGFGVIYMVAANLAQTIIAAMLMLFIYKFKANIKLGEWKFSWAKAKELLSQGWMVYLGAIFAMVYLKIDQVMLRWYEGSTSVGVYAVAAQLSEAWYFIPTAIVASLFPKLIQLKETSPDQFIKRFQQLLDLLFIMGLSTAILMTFISEWLVLLFFGEHYAQSANILVVHVWAAIFIFMRAAFSRWILIENALMFSLVTQGVGAIINVILNFIFIPKYGAIGAAYTTLASYAFASYASLYFYQKTRPVFFMMTKSLLAPIRYVKLR